MKRTIQTTPTRSRHLALAAACLGLPDSEAVIQSFVTAGLKCLADNDPTFKMALLRAADVDWETVERVTKETAK